MAVLFVNAAFREGSRTLRLAEKYLEKCGKDVKRIELGDSYPKPLDREGIAIYNQAVASHDFSHPMFDAPKEFVEAEEIVIAAPFWNFTLPAALHAYLEMVCTQGISFDMSGNGQYYSLCKAKKLTFITTAGGKIPEIDHSFGYIKTLVDVFWKIEEVKYIKADGIDMYGTDVEKVLSEVIQTF